MKRLLINAVALIVLVFIGITIYRRINIIESVYFKDCTIFVKTLTKEFPIGKLEDSGGDSPKCIANPKYEISKSGKYLIYEDISGGVDLAIKIYSLDINKTNTFAVWGTSSLLDIEFLKDDRLILWSGYPDIPAEQYAAIYDLKSLYENYNSNVDENGYLKIEDYKNIIALTPAEGKYFKIDVKGNKAYLYGGTPGNHILRGEFEIN